MKKFSKLIGLSLLLLLSLCMFGCPSGPEVVVVTATEEGLAFDLSSFGVEKETIFVHIHNPKTKNIIKITNPKEDFVFPYVTKGNNYTVKITVGIDLKREVNIKAIGGKGDVYVKSNYTYDSNTKVITMTYETDELVSPVFIDPYVRYKPKSVFFNTYGVLHFSKHSGTESFNLNEWKAENNGLLINNLNSELDYWNVKEFPAYIQLLKRFRMDCTEWSVSIVEEDVNRPVITIKK